MRKHPTTQRPLNRPPSNTESIREIPATHITDIRRMNYIERAEAGEDVYAYGSVDSPTGIINVWEWDTRIPLFPLEQWVWELEGSQPIMPVTTYAWTLTFQRRNTEEMRVITVTIACHMPAKDLPAYGQRVGRVCRMIEGNINLYGDDPQKYHDCHF